MGDKGGGDGDQPSALIQVDGSTDAPSSSCQSSADSELLSHLSSVVAHEQLINTSVKSELEKTKVKNTKIVFQLDGLGDSSSSDEEDEDNDDEEDDDDEEDEEDDDDDDETEDKPEPKKQEEPELGSDDDVSTDEDPTELFDTDNVVVCQYDKIHRTKSRWKFNLKVGIMSLNGRDHVFQKATGEANW